MVTLADNDGHSWILKASSERAKEAESKGRIQETANAVAERRGRDLVDFLAIIEQREGWSGALDCLRKSFHEEYPIPMRSAGYRAPVEPLKYREMVFELFSCTGLEPVNCDTMILLDELEDEDSLVSATSRFVQRTEELAADQVASGDTLFFDFSDTRSPETMLLLEKARRTEARIVRDLVSRGMADLRQLWLTEIGRIVLSELGVRGLDAEDLDGDVMFVLHALQERLPPAEYEKPLPELIRPENERPLNEFYRRLLESIINQDEEVLCAAGSRWSVPTLNVMLYSSLASYQTTESSDSYRQLIRNTGDHVVVRAPESVPTLSRLARLEDTRISTLAIAALGSFYHESAASVLIDIVCEAASKESVDASLSALYSIAKKCPEARRLVAETVHSERPNRRRLRNLYREMPHGLPEWYRWE